MAARANLFVSNSVLETFTSAQEASSNIRALEILIANEELVLARAASYEGTAQEDFDRVLVGLLGPTQASLVLFCLSDVGTTGRKWVLVSWIPDGCRVRDKMLYASSREDLKRTLGLGYFTAEYGANVITDVNWEAYQTYIRKDLNKDHLMTESERLLRDEDALARVESTSTKSTAMGVISFNLGDGVVTAYQEFAAGQCNWLEFSLVSEVVILENSKTVEGKDHLQAHINPDHARFIFVKLPSQSGAMMTFFIFSCPENVQVKVKMTMSTSKASVIASAADNGVKIDRTIEIRGADEIVDQVSSALGFSTSDSVGAASSAAAASLHSKPVRPGRGKAKVSKFQSEDDA